MCSINSRLYLLCAYAAAVRSFPAADGGGHWLIDRAAYSRHGLLGSVRPENREGGEMPLHGTYYREKERSLFSWYFVYADLLSLPCA